MSDVTLPAVGIAFLLSQVGAHSAYTFEQKLAEIDLIPQHAGVLRMLGNNPGMTQKAMSDLFGIFPSRLVALIDTLEGRGLLTRENNPDDRRSYNLHLTDLGKQCLQKIGALTIELEQDMLSALTQAELDTLSTYLRRIIALQKVTPAVHPAYRNQNSK
ncbi:MAG: MarR family transcriptional regulator [Usitatibacteraceae bacterium]